MYNKIVLFNTIDMLVNTLTNKNFMIKSNIHNLFTNNIFFTEKYLINENKINNKYFNVRIVKKYCCFDNHFDSIIGGIDYTVNDNHIKIEKLFISDYDYNKNEKTKYYYSYILNDEDAVRLKKSIITYITNIAVNNNINKIIIDVYQDLKFYNRYLADEGFKVLNKICFDNPLWLETVKII